MNPLDQYRESPPPPPPRHERAVGRPGSSIERQRDEERNGVTCDSLGRRFCMQMNYPNAPKPLLTMMGSKIVEQSTEIAHESLEKHGHLFESLSSLYSDINITLPYEQKIVAERRRALQRITRYTRLSAKDLPISSLAKDLLEEYQATETWLNQKTVMLSPDLSSNLTTEKDLLGKIAAALKINLPAMAAFIEYKNNPAENIRQLKRQKSNALRATTMLLTGSAALVVGTISYLGNPKNPAMMPTLMYLGPFFLAWFGPRLLDKKDQTMLTDLRKTFSEEYRSSVLKILGEGHSTEWAEFVRQYYKNRSLFRKHFKPDGTILKEDSEKILALLPEDIRAQALRMMKEGTFQEFLRVLDKAPNNEMRNLIAEHIEAGSPMRPARSSI